LLVIFVVLHYKSFSSRTKDNAGKSAIDRRDVVINIRGKYYLMLTKTGKKYKSLSNNVPSTVNIGYAFTNYSLRLIPDNNFVRSLPWSLDSFFHQNSERYGDDSKIVLGYQTMQEGDLEIGEKEQSFVVFPPQYVQTYDEQRTRRRDNHRCRYFNGTSIYCNKYRFVEIAGACINVSGALFTRLVT